MPWTKYEVEGKYRKGIVRIFEKCILDNGDSDGKDSYPGGPDEYGFRIIRPCRCVKCRDNVAQDKRHAPVPDDEINLGEPSRGRLRIAAMSQRRGEELRAEIRIAIASDSAPTGVYGRQFLTSQKMAQTKRVFSRVLASPKLGRQTSEPCGNIFCVPLRFRRSRTNKNSKHVLRRPPCPVLLDFFAATHAAGARMVLKWAE